MKKSLFALAALTAVAGAAQAQSNVTLYGVVDASAFYLNNPSNTSTNTSTNASGAIDSAFASSIWGLKGSEDLGGGLKANFNVEGDLSTVTGNASSQGIFRRATNVGFSGNFGEVALGLKISPFVSAANTNWALGNNSISLSADVANGYAQFFTKNAITYTLPSMNGLNGQFQYGMSNTTDGASAGNVYAGRLNYTLGGLYLEAAGQKLNSGTVSPNAAASYVQATPTGTVSATGTATAAATYNPGGTTSGDQSTYFVGAKYKIGQATVGAGWLSNTIAGWVINVTQLSAAYAVNPKLDVGVNYSVNTNDSSLTNVVASYKLSPRTSVYGMVNYAKVGNFNAGPNAAGAANTATGATTGAYAAVWSEGNIAGAAPAANTNTTAFGVGVVHCF